MRRFYQSLGLKRSTQTVLGVALSASLSFSLFPLVAFSQQLEESPLPQHQPLLSLSLPMTIDGYSAQADVRETLSTAEQVLNIIDHTSKVAIHYEALRRSATQLSPEEQATLVDTLATRHRSDRSLVMGYFDYGLVKWLFERNQSSLLYLRKAHESMRNPFTSLIYAIAQIDADRVIDNADGSAPTRRKYDVGYLLKDAVNYDVAKHRPGFWPSLIKLLTAMQPMSAFNDATLHDYSVAYVPYGVRQIAFTSERPPTIAPTTTASSHTRSVKSNRRQQRARRSKLKRRREVASLSPEQSLTPSTRVVSQRSNKGLSNLLPPLPAAPPSLDDGILAMAISDTPVNYGTPTPIEITNKSLEATLEKQNTSSSATESLQENIKSIPLVNEVESSPVTTPLSSSMTLVRVVEADFLNTGSSLKLQFFKADNNGYRLIGKTAEGAVVADFLTPVAPYVFEDLDRDGVYELVVRAYEKTPLNPIRVYRYEDGQYQLDEQIASMFR